jgi:hypothetical protein
VIEALLRMKTTLTQEALAARRAGQAAEAEARETV